MVFYRAIFSEKFSFTMSGDATDALNIKVFTTISSGSESSERMLECLRYRVKDNLVKFFDQTEILEDMKQSKKCKLAFKGRWLHSEDQLKYRTLKEELGKKYGMVQAKKRKLEKAEIMLTKARQ